jgi:hypothetical protein
LAGDLPLSVSSASRRIKRPVRAPRPAHVLQLAYFAVSASISPSGKEGPMRPVNLLGIAGLLTAALLLAAAPPGADEKRAPDDKHPHAAAFLDCAKACSDCQRECDSCALHCADLVAAGKKDHLRTLGTCADCANFCATAAQIVARQGPLSATICEACAKACDVCGSACEKFADDEHMKRCAQECRRCEKACREMLKHTGDGK